MELTHFESLYPANTRFAEIEKIVQYMKQGNSCQIVALPGVGRSTILGLLAYNYAVRKEHLGEKQSTYHFVLINFSEVRRRPLLDVNKFLFLSLVDSLRDRQFEDAYQKTLLLFKESVAFEDELVLFQGLKNAIDILTVEKQLTVVFLFDRFEEYIPMLNADFFANLRVLRNRAKYQFSVVFSLLRPLEESIESALMTEFYDFVVGHTIYLPIVDDPGLLFRLKHLEEAAGKTITKNTVDQVMQLTGKFTRAGKACFHILLSSAEPYPSSRSDLETFLLQHKAVQRPLFEMWQSLTPAEQEHIRINLNRMKDLPSGKRTFFPAQDSNNDISIYLQNVGLLKNDTLTIPLFETFLYTYILSTPAETGQQERITYDAARNEIRQGSIVLSDSLTSAEFRLLRHLLQNPERVIEREEIITTVWNDAASTAGVTDQALDQLIFRLRKKLETEPTNPQHLQTVKGRGYKFLP